MDQATHFVSGIIQGKFFASRYNLGGIVLVSIIAALIPDIDIITLLLGKKEYVIHHRALSHGIFFAFIWAFLIVSFATGIKKASWQGFGKIFWIAFICILGHLYLDLMTSYGTSLLSPAIKNRYALDAMFIVDPIYWFVLFLAYIFMRLKKVNGKLLYTVLMIVWFFYPLGAFGVKVYVENNMAKQYAPYKVNALPDALAPLRWKVVVQKDDNFTLLVYNVLTKREVATKDFKIFNPPNPADEWEKDGFLNFFFKEFLRFPVEENQGKYSIIYDLRFYPTIELGKDSERNSPFALKIAKDVSGKLLWYEFSGERQYLSP